MSERRSAKAGKELPSHGRGDLCVEEDPEHVRVIHTHNRLACIDGRFPHWVSGYSGERYSVIFYRSAGSLDPVVKAVHELPGPP